jgi:hypothetical protein
MPYIQELCVVRMTWLQPGQICLLSKLGLNDFAERSVLASYRASSRPVWAPLSNDRLLSALLSAPLAQQRDCPTPDNPLVKVRVPVTIYEFEPAGPKSWLADQITEYGAEAVFGGDLPDLDGIGAHLRLKGDCQDRSAFGLTVAFQTLWVYSLKPEAVGWKSVRELCGYIDLTRVPLTLFAEKPRPQEKQREAITKRAQRAPPKLSADSAVLS